MEHDGTMLCLCHNFERRNLWTTTGNEGERQVFLGFNHHDVSVHWWASYMLYTYKASTPMVMNCNFHRLAMNNIKGPKQRVQISCLLALEDADDIATAIFRLKNYPGESIDISKLRETVNTKRIVHLSQTQEERRHIMQCSMILLMS